MVNDIFLFCQLKILNYMLENSTRWGSSFLVLESILRAYEKDAIDSNNPEHQLPIPIQVIENYMNVLKPVYLCNVGFQSNNAKISNVIPSLLKLIYKLEKLKTSLQGKMLVTLLINEIKEKFNYELNSELYQVCS